MGEPYPVPPGACRDNRRHVQLFVCSTDGARILTTGAWRSGRQECAQVWGAANSRSLGPLLCHDGAIRAVGLSGDGYVAITGSEDRTARLWDARTGASLCVRIATPGSRAGGGSRHAAGTLAVTTAARTGPLARLWKVPGGEPLGDPLHHPGQVLAVAFPPDGRAVLTGCDDGVARLWTLFPTEPTGTPVPDVDLKAAFASRPIARWPNDPDGAYRRHGSSPRRGYDAAARAAAPARVRHPVGGHQSRRFSASDRMCRRDRARPGRPAPESPSTGPFATRAQSTLWRSAPMAGWC